MTKSEGIGHPLKVGLLRTLVHRFVPDVLKPENVDWSISGRPSNPQLSFADRQFVVVSAFGQGVHSCVVTALRCFPFRHTTAIIRFGIVTNPTANSVVSNPSVPELPLS